VPVLTGLAADQRQPGFCLVEVDRRRFASLPAEALAALDLHIGEEITPRVLERLGELAAVEAAHRAALRALTHRSHARLGLRIRLLKRRHPLFAVEAALERLARCGLLDDRRFAAAWAGARAPRGHGPARIVRDLQAEGVDRLTAEAAVREALGEAGFDPTATLLALAEKRAHALRSVPPTVRARRVLAFLARRGFVGAPAREAVERVLAR
jgi:regulatory protein